MCPLDELRTPQTTAMNPCISDPKAGEDSAGKNEISFGEGDSILGIEISIFEFMKGKR